MKTALIAGATGLTGSNLLPLLLESEDYQKVYVLSRRPIEIDHPKAELILSDFSNLAQDIPDTTIDDVFCCLGTTIKTAGSKEAFRQVDYHHCLEVATQSLARGASHFLVISALGANPKALSFYSKTKGELENALKSLDYSSLTILQPSLLDGERTEHRSAEELSLKILRPFKSITEKIIPRYAPISVQEVAATLFYCATHSKPGLDVIESDQIRDIARRT